MVLKLCMGRYCGSNSCVYLFLFFGTTSPNAVILCFKSCDFVESRYRESNQIQAMPSGITSNGKMLVLHLPSVRTSLTCHIYSPFLAHLIYSAFFASFASFACLANLRSLLFLAASGPASVSIIRSHHLKLLE
jgi:hypothetical protein